MQTLNQSRPADVTRADIGDFLTDEAALLDEWRLEEWLDLVAPDGRYLIPSPSAPDAEWRTTLYLVADDHATLTSRVRQLLGGAVWANNPRARTRRLVTNPRILEIHDNTLRITANFAVWHFQNNKTDVYVGRYLNTLVQTERGLKFVERKAVLDNETLRPHGKISIIL
jgi:p-cumate 2,3-dioxygenase beta subunit